MKDLELQEKINNYQHALDTLIDVHDLYQADKYRKAIDDLRTDITNFETEFDNR